MELLFIFNINFLKVLFYLIFLYYLLFLNINSNNIRLNFNLSVY